jgi:hypothetical protein
MRGNSKRTTPIGLSRYAREFLDCAEAADDQVGAEVGYEIVAPIPVMYLVGHAIELSLKAYLSYNGISLEDLARKNYGHNLVACYDKACELGLLDILDVEPVDSEVLKVLNELYCTKQLNYIVTGPKTFPVFGPLHDFSERLLRAVGPHVGYG